MGRRKHDPKAKVVFLTGCERFMYICIYAFVCMSLHAHKYTYLCIYLYTCAYIHLNFSCYAGPIAATFFPLQSQRTTRGRAAQLVMFVNAAKGSDNTPLYLLLMIEMLHDFKYQNGWTFGSIIYVLCDIGFASSTVGLNLWSLIVGVINSTRVSQYAYLDLHGRWF